jgi:tetratricopeptide (TPR) repeat protein
LIDYLKTPPVSIVTGQSAVLTEKLGDLYWTRKKLSDISDALDAYEAALTRYPSPQQKKRLLLLLAQRRGLYGPDEQAIGFYKQFINEYPDYSEVLTIYHRLLLLAKKVGDKAEIERCEREIERLSPPSAAAK